MKLDDAVLQQLAARVGPEAVEFAAYVSTELWARARRTALRKGFTSVEADYIARVTCLATIKAMASATSATGRARAFRSPN
jgi:hypothetical protein